MFGKKEKAEKPAKVVKEKASKAPKKAKASSGKSGPGFFALHVEKLILGIVLATVGYVIYAGISQKGYPTDRAPEALRQSSTQVLNQISEDHNPEIFADREVKHAFVAEVEKARRAIDSELYPMGSLREAASGPLELRGDPKILPPEQLVVKCVSGAIAIEVPNETPDPFDAFEDAPRVSLTRVRPPRGGNRTEEEEEDEDKIKPPARRLMSKYDLGVQIGGMPGGGMGMMGGMEGGMGMMGGMEGGMGMGMEGGPGGMGGRGGMMGGMGSMGGGAAGGAGGGGLAANRNVGPKTKVASQAAIFVAATALVKHKEMADEYERLLKNSGDYVLMRDTPVYLSFEIQRVDVSQNPVREIQEKEWKTISDGIKQVALQKNWAVKPPLGRPVPEIIDFNARHKGLTMPIPPMFVKDYREFSKHPAIDWVWDTKRLIAPRKRETKKSDEDDVEVLPGQNESVGGAAGGMGMAGGRGMGGMGEMGGMEGGMGAMGSDGYGGMGDMGDMGGMGDMGMGGYGDMSGMGEMGGGGMGMEGGYGGMGMGGGMSMSSGPQPEFKMLRFYDMLTPQDIGKAYRYRVRLIMRDPNYPDTVKRRSGNEWVDFEIPGPKPTTLQKEVFDRVADQRRIDDAAIKADKKARRKMLETAWSEPSQAVRITSPVEAFAGTGFDTVPNNPRVSAVLDQEAMIVATRMELPTGVTYARNFPKALRGSVLNAKKELTEFIVPANRVIKQRETAFASNTMVVDMRGGEELAASSKRDGDLLAANGEVMLLVSDGTVLFTSDIDDTFEYRMYTFADEHENARRAGPGMGGMGSGMGMGEGGMGDGMGGMGSGMGMGEGGGGPAAGGRGGRGGK